MIYNFYLHYMTRLKTYLTINLMGGPKPFQMRHIINCQKGMTMVVMLSLMSWYDNWSWAACVYTALHGSYGIVWILKDQIMRDKSWDAYVTVPSFALAGVVLAGYWSAGFLIISQNIRITPIRASVAIMMHTFGIVFMMCADTQKYYVLKHKQGLISDGWLARSRNTNYLGEVMLYSAYAVLAQHWLPWTVNGFMWIMAFATNMIAKEESLRKKAGAKEYLAKSGLFFPNLYAWLLDYVSTPFENEAKDRETRNAKTEKSSPTKTKRVARSRSRSRSQSQSRSSTQARSRSRSRSTRE